MAGNFKTDRSQSGHLFPANCGSGRILLFLLGNHHVYPFFKITWKFGDNACGDNLQTGEATFKIIRGRVATKGDIDPLEQFLKQQHPEINWLSENGITKSLSKKK
jgi:hypothetical protein